MNNMKKHQVFIENNYLSMPINSHDVKFDVTNQKLVQTVGTILNNMSYYGYMPANASYMNMLTLNVEQLEEFWKSIEPAFAEVTKENRNMDNFVVYKNFPNEVLTMSESRYWIAQIFMYLGMPNEMFTEEKQERPLLTEKKALKVLSLADENTFTTIFSNLMKNHSRWSNLQTDHAQFLVEELKLNTIDMDSVSFKENGVNLMAQALKNTENLKNMNFIITTATDVMRLAAAMSGGDVSLRENVKFRKFSRPERKFLLSKLENASNLLEDASSRPEQFKKLLKCLHPNDYARFKNVHNVYNALYQGKLSTYSSIVEVKLFNNDISVLHELQTRPGDFFRRFHHVYSKFGQGAIDAFTNIVEKLDTAQLVKLDKYLETIDNRTTLMYPPKGNWTKAQIVPNKKAKFNDSEMKAIRLSIEDCLKTRLANQLPEGVALDSKVEQVKLQTNDQKLATYGRGTSFDIPEDMKFIRSASYWKQTGYGNNWFDNGWNFFDADWKTSGTCCWDHTHDMGESAIFSGDPTNSKEMEGRACQMIDLYLDKLQEKGIRYAVWNILAYSGIKFSEAEEVLATLQWGENAQEGNLYEPSRAQMIFPLTSDSLTSYVAYIDIVERKLVYMDANLYGSKMSAGNNSTILQEKMPAYIQYLSSLPTVLDVFKHAPNGIIPVLYSDKDVALQKDQSAYVFKLENENNDIKRVDLSSVLEGENITSHINKSKIKSRL